MLTSASTDIFSFSQPVVVVLCPHTERARYLTLLHTCHVAVTSEAGLAFQSLCCANPALVIVDGDGQDDRAVVCDAVKAITPAPPTLLVTLSQPEGAGQVIDRCDSILLKPFAPA